MGSEGSQATLTGSQASANPCQVLRRTIVRVALVVALGSGCGARERRAETAAPIDVEAAVRSIEALVVPATLPAHELATRAGGLQLTDTLSLRVQSEGREIEALDDRARIELAPGGDFTAVQENSRDLGRSVTFVGGKLYVQMRYGATVERRPEHGEAMRLLDDAAGLLPATFRLLESFLEVTDGGTAAAAGRAARRARLGLAKTPREVVSLGAQQAWRQRLSVASIEGELLLDANTGVVLAAHLAARYRFPREKSEAEATLVLDRKLERTGQDPVIHPPADAVATPRRLRYEPERRQLLRGLEGAP